MGVIIDIIGMMVVRASIIAIILNLMVNLHEALYKQAERMYLSETLTAATQTISADLKLAGYNATTAALKRFPRARTNDMIFRADYDTNGTLDQIRFYVNPTTGTDMVLYRTINGGSQMEIARDVDTFYVRYYTASGSAVSGTADVTVKSVFVRLVIRSRYTETVANAGTSDAGVRRAKWEQFFFPENL